MASRVIRKVRDMLDVDDAAIANGKTLVYRTASGKHEYEAAGGAADLSSAVILAPAASARNVIQPTLGSVIAAVVRAHAAQTVDIFRVENAAASIQYLRVLSNGRLAATPATFGASVGDEADYYTAFELLTNVAVTTDGEFNWNGLRSKVVVTGAGGTASQGLDTVGAIRAHLSMENVEAAADRYAAYYAQAFSMLAETVPSFQGYIGELTAGYAIASHRGIGEAASIGGLFGAAKITGSPTVSPSGGFVQMFGVSGATENTSDKEIELAANFYAPAPYVGAAAGSRFTELAGVYVANQGDAKVKTSYGLRVVAQSGASIRSYGVVVLGGVSYFTDTLLLGRITAPADADIANSQGGWWWDQANSLPKWKGKTSGGVVVNFVPSDATALADHLADAADAHDASAISFTPTGTVAATDVQAAIAEVASEAAGGGIPATIVDAKGDLIAATAADTVARLAVGSNDQVLTADSAQATGLKWAAAGGGISATLFDANTVLKADTDDTPVALTMGASTILARLAAGNIKAASVAEIATLLGGYAFTAGIVYASGYIGSGFGGVVDRMDLTAFPAVYQATTFDRIGIYCNNATATAVVRLGIYNDVGGVPDTLVLDAGTVDCSTTGEKTITISQLLPPGRYWLAAVPQVAVAANAYDMATRGNDFSSGGVGGVFYHAIKYGGMFTHSAAVSGALPTPTASWVQDGGIRVAMRAA